jgi:hypothetical protein
MENIKMRLRAEMCNMLCSMGHNMEELEMCSNSELMQMCQDKMNGYGMMENYTMSREEMCMMLCNMGYNMEELEMCSNNELKKMCRDKMKMDMIEKNKKKMHMMSESSRIIKSWKNFK